MPGPLVDVQAWQVVDAPDDPFPDRPDDFRCGAGGAHVEGLVYEIETDRCAYVTATQPSLRRVRVGDRVRVVMWHLTLVADEPADAHMAVAIGDHVVAEERMQLPFPPRLLTVEWTAPEGFPAGTPVFLHAHNHGANSYRFGEVTLLGPGDP